MTTTPTEPQARASTSRGLGTAASSSTTKERFGRVFRQVPTSELADETLLRGAAVVAGGEQLGSVVGSMVAEALVGLLEGDPMSCLSVEPTWKPTVPARVDGQFTLRDLINLAVPVQESPTLPPSVP